MFPVFLISDPILESFWEDACESETFCGDFDLDFSFNCFAGLLAGAAFTSDFSFVFTSGADLASLVSTNLVSLALSVSLETAGASEAFGCVALLAGTGV